MSTLQATTLTTHERAWWQSPQARKEALEGLLCLLPWIIGFLAFTAGPLLYSTYISFTDYPILKEPRWIGLENYVSMANDDLFWKSLRVTALYTLVAVPGGVIIGYVIALLLNQQILGLSFWRTAYYVPAVVPAVATSYLWAWMFNPDFGVINGFLLRLGVAPPKWFGSEEWVLPAFIIMSLWGAGGGLVLYLAALQGVPTSLYDAAKVDGANGWHRLRHVTLPMTSPVILFTFLTGLISSFQVFTAGFLITNGGPNNASLFYVLYLYRVGWKYFKMGYASALGWVLFLIIMILTLLTLRASGRLVYYENSEEGR